MSDASEVSRRTEGDVSVVGALLALLITFALPALFLYVCAMMWPGVLRNSPLSLVLIAALFLSPSISLYAFARFRAHWVRYYAAIAAVLVGQLATLAMLNDWYDVLRHWRS